MLSGEGVSASAVGALSDAGREMLLVERLNRAGLSPRPGKAERGYMWAVQLSSGVAQVQVIRRISLEALEARLTQLTLEP